MAFDFGIVGQDKTEFYNRGCPASYRLKTKAPTQPKLNEIGVAIAMAVSCMKKHKAEGHA
jgi:hypothetical protein